MSKRKKKKRKKRYVRKHAECRVARSFPPASQPGNVVYVGMDARFRVLLRTSDLPSDLGD